MSLLKLFYQSSSNPLSALDTSGTETSPNDALTSKSSVNEYLITSSNGSEYDFFKILPPFYTSICIIVLQMEVFVNNEFTSLTC